MIMAAPEPDMAHIYQANYGESAHLVTSPLAQSTNERRRLSR